METLFMVEPKRMILALRAKSRPKGPSVSNGDRVLFSTRKSLYLPTAETDCVGCQLLSAFSSFRRYSEKTPIPFEGDFCLLYGIPLQKSKLKVGTANVPSNPIVLCNDE